MLMDMNRSGGFRLGHGGELCLRKGGVKVWIAVIEKSLLYILPSVTGCGRPSLDSDTNYHINVSRQG